MRRHAAALFGDARKMTRLDPPARETPEESPVGPGRGAVDHLSCTAAGSRFAKSPMYHGPLMYIAKVPRPNSCATFDSCVLPNTGARLSRKSPTYHSKARRKAESLKAP